MVNKEIPFDEFILSQIPEQKYDQADFTSLPHEMRTFLHLLHPNPRDQIAYIASEHYEQVTRSVITGWMGVVKTQDLEGVNALLILCQPQKPLQDLTLLEGIRSPSRMLVSILKPFFKVESRINLAEVNKKQDNEELAIMVAKALFTSKPTHFVEGVSFGPIDTAWPATLVWEHEFNQS